MKMIFKAILILLSISLVSTAYSKTVRYEFDINTTMINVTGKKAQAISVGNQIPGAVIEAIVGDRLEVTFHNKLNEDASIHWHGVLLPNDQDGVPYLTTPPIPPHSSFTFHYPIIHSGTYWYHSHSGLQEQIGVYGPLVFHPKKGELIRTDQDHVLVLSDWNDESPYQVLANLKKDGDYYALKKHSTQSWLGIFQNGLPALKKRLKNAFNQMPPMDLSDVGYDAFLANGKTEEALSINAGKTLRLRIINAATSTYFNLEFAGGSMKIVAADGVDIEPIDVKDFQIAMAETYDVIFEVPMDGKAYELRAMAVDGTGYSSTFIGMGDKVFLPDADRPNLYLMGTALDKMPMLDYTKLRALENTNFSNTIPRREITLNLTGDMNRYIWSFNNKTLLESDKLLIKKGEIVRITLKNKTMMAHPLHLHGHFFRVLNGQGDKSPLKHTVNVPSLGEVTIEFLANTEKDWFFHCHNLYHLATGMARIVSYEDTTKATRKTFHLLEPDQYFFSSDTGAFSNMLAGNLRATNTRNSFKILYDYDYEKEYDVELTYLRNFTRLFDAYAGINLSRNDKDKKPNNTAITGIRYLLPMMIRSDLRIDSEAKVRLELGAPIQLTERFRADWSWNTDREYRTTLSYEINKKLLLSTHYDSDFKWGAGIRIKL